MLSHALLLMWKYLEYPLYFVIWKAYIVLQVDFSISMSERKAWLVYAIILGAAVLKLVKNWRDLDKQSIELEKEKEELRSLKLDNDIKEKRLNS